MGSDSAYVWSVKSHINLVLNEDQTIKGLFLESPLIPFKIFPLLYSVFSLRRNISAEECCKTMSMFLY